MRSAVACRRPAFTHDHDIGGCPTQGDGEQRTRGRAAGEAHDLDAGHVRGGSGERRVGVCDDQHPGRDRRIRQPREQPDDVARIGGGASDDRGRARLARPLDLRHGAGPAVADDAVGLDDVLRVRPYHPALGTLVDDLPALCLDERPQPVGLLPSVCTPRLGTLTGERPELRRRQLLAGAARESGPGVRRDRRSRSRSIPGRRVHGPLRIAYDRPMSDQGPSPRQPHRRRVARGELGRGRSSRATRLTTGSVIGTFAASDASDVAAAVRAAGDAERGLAAHPGTQARRDPVRLRCAHGAAQGTPRAPHDRRDGQGPGRGTRRRPGGHRHRVPDGGGGPSAVRGHGALRAARQVGDEHPGAHRGRGAHHALELPDGHPVLEDDAGAHQRQHRRAQAGVRHTRLRAAPGGAAGGGRPAAGCRQPRHRSGRDRGHGARGESRRAGHQLHRQQRHRQAHRGGRRAGGSSACRWSWAARTPSWCWRTRTSTSRSRASCGPRSAPPASAAPRAAGSWSRTRSRTHSSSGWSTGRRRCGWVRASTPRTQVGPLINAAALAKVAGYVQVGLDEGAQLLTGGERATGPGLEHGHFFQPTIFDRVDPMCRLGQEEIFGPCCRSSGCPTTTRRSRSSTRCATACRRASTPATSTWHSARCATWPPGIVYVNAGTIGAETHLPFGGTRQTGNGHREAGHAALDTFTEWKSVYVDYSGRLQRAQIDNQPA